jgi:acyl-CoA synthetase (AMP-forming)/AMP-acid ligase II
VDAAYFVIAILGCADGGSACTPVATLQTHYATKAQCSAATTSALEKNSDFDFPTLVAKCSAASPTQAAEAPHEAPRRAAARRG